MFESQNMWIYEYKAFSLKFSYIGCGDPGHVPNGVRLNFTSFDAGGAATYQCHTGFLLNGSSTIFCQNNGQWTTLPSCSPESPSGFFINISIYINVTL